MSARGQKPWNYKCFSVKVGTASWDLMYLLREVWSVRCPVPKFDFFPIGKSCGTPPELINGRMTINGDTKFGSTVNYACNEG